ncbi:MAG: RecQ family ATP-dependent DNA helicase [Comamonadaceae bacterium]|nr:RecQ family ATP-dependent DNA helicase [Comamonadaceae bacterium]
MSLQHLLNSCVSLDLEVARKDSRIHQFAAVSGSGRPALTYKRGSLSPALLDLDLYCADARYLLGHNLIRFDLPQLQAAQPHLKLLSMPAIDTLWLNPLAFPRNPYHHLVKHYQDGQLQSGRLNNPELDARLTLTVLQSQLKAFAQVQQTQPDMLLAWHWLTTLDNASAGFDAVFAAVRAQPCPDAALALAAIHRLLHGQVCSSQLQQVNPRMPGGGWPLAYAMAWISVAGGNSVMPPWVRHQFPQAGQWVKQLRDTACADPACVWCAQQHDATQALRRWFTGIDDFRPQPTDSKGQPLQKVIIQAAMQGDSVLGILPTGTGKSVCYQLPALSRYDKTGALTVVISPLVALMADQVAGLEARGIGCCAAVNGLLSMPERADVLERLRLGDIAILIISPEQLRNRALRQALAQREIGAWVLDEAHCLSKWGHDFRPDYRYVSRFIKESAGDAPVPPVLCLTATAKPEVVADLLAHFADKVGISLRVFDGGSSRSNLEFVVVPTTTGEKLAHIHQVLMADLPPDSAGGAIIYCASRRQTEEVAHYLQQKAIAAGFFHAGLQPESKKSTQKRFIDSDLRVIVATNAFGMGIDKPDVRLVIHADIPGSLENYLQEAGRAGRDRAAARCVLLYTAEDVERQFSLSARSRLTQREISAILKSLRQLNRKKHLGGQIIATAGEILAEEEDGQFTRDSATDDTRVRTAISWLEESQLLTREENRVQIFPSSLRVRSLDEARARLARLDLTERYRQQLLTLVAALIAADADEGISTDELMGSSGLGAEAIRLALHDLEAAGIASNDTALTAFVHVACERASAHRLADARSLENALIDILRQAAPELERGEASTLHLRRVTQALKDAGHPQALPESVRRLLTGLAKDGRTESGGIGSLSLRAIDAETLHVKLQRDWQALARTAQLRQTAAGLLMAHLTSQLPAGARGVDLLAATTLGALLAVITSDVGLHAEVHHPEKLLDHALLWLHEQEVIRLNKGLAVFRPAMTIVLGSEPRRFAKADFAPLQLHYAEQVTQIHVMAEYVKRGLQAMADALRLTMDYFQLSREEFLKRWLPNRDKEISRQTTPASWRSIVEALRNPAQQAIVTDEREQTNVLVLAGPGSGKTRVLVHRIAYLVRVKRENPHGILALAYNRHAAVEIRRRLTELIGDDARGITVLTCHAMAMRLVGASFAGRNDVLAEDAFAQVLRQAVALLQGGDLPADEADAQRSRLLAGFRWILVDEYQDIGPDHYALISALAGRTRKEADDKLTLFAVGDDDQNIYAFNGASVDFIRRFAADYSATPAFLVDNYRSSGHIIAAANAVIAPAPHRMKAERPIHIDRARSKQPAGGLWQARDPVGQGRVQVLPVPADAVAQAVLVMQELQRLASLDTQWDWSRCAVIARNWAWLQPLRAFCELHGIPVQMADDAGISLWQLRETQALLTWLRQRTPMLVTAVDMRDWIAAQAPPANPWWALLLEAVEVYALEVSAEALPVQHFVDWLAEWGRDIRRKQTGLLLLSAHRAKGLEFDHVAVLDGGWQCGHPGDNPLAEQAEQRLYYVAMTRARQTLALCSMGTGRFLRQALDDLPAVLWREAVAPAVMPRELHWQYFNATLKDIDIGFAGRCAANHPIHSRLAALAPGDALALVQHEKKWLLQDVQGMTVGRMSASFDFPAGQVCHKVTVRAVLQRRRDQSTAEHQHRYLVDQWELLLPELVLT